MKTTISRDVVLALVGICLGVGQLLGQSVSLPTPKEHYESYNPETEALQLFSEMFAELDPAGRESTNKLIATIQAGNFDAVSPEQLQEMAQGLNWKKRRARILRLMVYQSGVLAVFSEEVKSWVPVVHDFLLFFLDRLGEERLMDRMMGMIRVAQGSDRGAQLLALIDRTPSLQKIGQILARNPKIPSDLRDALQTLENSIRTAKPDELVEIATRDLGPETIGTYRLEFEDKVLGEATIGAVIGVSLTLPGEAHSRRAVCKLVKPYAVAALNEELEILDGLAHYFEKHGEFYELGDISLSDLFQDVRKALSKEVQVLEEQKNLKRAYEYYRGNTRVKVPELYPLSSKNVTVMERINGGRIVDAFVGEAKARSELASRLDRVMTLDVIFADQEEAVFHADPHAGNVFFVRDQSDDPYQIALLDWGLLGVLSRRERAQLIQLMLGLRLNNEKRVRNNVGVLIEGGFPDSLQEVQRIQTIAVDIAKQNSSTDHFAILEDMITRLSKAGYRLSFNLVLFIKAQVTIAGILHQLDPQLKRGERFFQHLAGQVLKEAPKRLLYTVYFPKWTSHDYPSMVSNEDVRDSVFHGIGRGLKKLGAGIWRGISFPF